MRDIRIDRWADVIVNYALEAKKGEHAVIISEPEAKPLLEACYEKLLKAGATVEPFIIPSSFTEIQYEFASDDQLKTTPKVLQYAVENCDLYITLYAETNSKRLGRFDPKRQSMASQARQPIVASVLNRAAENKLRWIRTHFPTSAMAQDAEMGTKEYEELVFSLGYLNDINPTEAWKKIEARQQKVVDYLNTKKVLQFKNSQGTDLTVNIDGMQWVNCCGKINFPDGEVFSGPNLNVPDGGVNGVARYALPTLYRNNEVHDIEIKFENGVVVEANASKGQDFLREMINQDPGAKRMGEIAIGTNYNMKNITKDILFDEKFGGTFHFALGKGYPETGNTNNSALHWDMIFDLRHGGSITADGDLFYVDGRFLNPEWPQP